MKFIERQLIKVLLKASETFPAILVTGPRQSGKTTLLKEKFSEHTKFVSMENPEKRLWAKEDPNDFLKSHSPPVIIDEFQYASNLLPYIKDMIDNNRKPGSFYFTGSQQLLAMNNISQSLAGRVAITTLMPLSYSESINDINKSWDLWFEHLINGKQKKSKNNLGNILLKGFFPEIISNKKIDTNLWFNSYIQTYLERDAKTIYSIGNLDVFHKFITLLAARCGSILNYSTYSTELGVSIPTIKKWFSIMEASFIVFKLQPYYENIGKRISKSHKFYFIDTGLAAYLAGINNADFLLRSNMGGNYFENFIISEFYKNKLNFNENLNMYFINHRNLWEIDLLLEKNREIIPVEIKFTSTVKPEHFKNFKKVREPIKIISKENVLICNQVEPILQFNTNITSWKYL